MKKSMSFGGKKNHPHDDDGKKRCSRERENGGRIK